MYDFCHHCGRTIGQDQQEGQVLTCRYCGETIGVVKKNPGEKKVVVQTPQNAGKCPACSQLVQLKDSPGGKSLVPHFVTGGPRKMCPGSGKLLGAETPPSPAAAAPKPPAGKDLSAHYTRETIRVVACSKEGNPNIEEFQLQYLDKKDRVRMQIDAVREILGKQFQMKSYPAPFSRPEFGMWGNSAQCVIAKKHPQGGFQSLNQEEIGRVINDLKNRKNLFFAG